MACEKPRQGDRGGGGQYPVYQRAKVESLYLFMLRKTITPDEGRCK